MDLMLKVLLVILVSTLAEMLKLLLYYAAAAGGLAIGIYMAYLGEWPSAIGWIGCAVYSCSSYLGWREVDRLKNVKL